MLSSLGMYFCPSFFENFQMVWIDESCCIFFFFFKGYLIWKCPFGVFNSTKKPTKIFCRSVEVLRGQQIKLTYSSVPNRRACTFINFEKIFPPARSYFGLHVYWFWEKIPPARLFHPMWTALFWSACLIFSKNFPTCTFILSYTSIWYTRVCKFSTVWADLAVFVCFFNLSWAKNKFKICLKIL